jgi:phage tail-like protein
VEDAVTKSEPAPTPPAGPNQPPLPVFCFKVMLTVKGFMDSEAYFKSVGGLKYETESVDVKVGGVNHTTFKLIGATKYPNLVFKRGFAKDSKLLTWRQSWLTPVEGKRPGRISGKIVQLGNDMIPLCAFEFVRGIPVKWELTEYDASKSELAIETLEIAHEGLTYSSTP